ncbi:zinc finger protein 76 (expressed in testis) [Ophiostoma piceae UAMH 11346]|uniref:Zinc finger protein 76 (Expressed in testis) n=1 Tax=Ophiostoma piceae (strain UAMH 11346) TaxID=1262450 RepID=S3BP89_OPHP1|nr:zinc finger protein 76 (expressed in testis) [Ophiostoma piceae UAMH 11346]
MSIPQEDGWASWSNNTTFETSSDINSFDFNETDLDFDLVLLAHQDQTEDSPYGLEIATPNYNPATSPDVHVLSGESPGRLSMTELEQFVKDLSEGACMASSIFPEEFLPPQQSLMVSTMDYSDGYFPLDIYAPITEEELATMPTTLLIDSYMSMPGPAVNTRSHTGPVMDMYESILTEPVTSPMAYYDQTQFTAQALPVPAPVPSSTPLPGLPIFTHASLSPRTNEDGMSDSVLAGSPGSVVDGHTGSGNGSSGPSKFYCQEKGCTKSFSITSQLKKHTKRHEKPYKCPVCDKGHGAKKDTDRHMWTKHSEEAERRGIPNPNEPCPVEGCTGVGRKSDNLSRHIKTQHPDYPAQERRAAK